MLLYNFVMTDENFSIRLGQRIFTARKRHSAMTQDDLGSAVGVTSQAVSEWERGKAIPELDKIPLIAQKLEVTVEWLITGQDEVVGWPKEIWGRLDTSERELARRLLQTIKGQPII